MRSMIAKSMRETWSPRFGGTGALVVPFLFLLSILDIRYNFPQPVWMLLSGMYLLIAQGVGMGMFGTDITKGYVHFLNTLPIRRSRYFLALWLDALMLLVALLLALIWYRLLVFWPASTDPAASTFFASRVSLFFDLLMGAVAACAYMAFMRSFFQRDAVAVPLIFGVELALAAVPASLLLLHAVLPRPEDVLLMVAGLAVLFSAAGYLSVAVPPRHWSALRRFLLTGLPAIIAIGLLTFAGVELSIRQWPRLDPSRAQISYVQVLSDGRTMLVSVYDPRSMNHLLRVDMVTGGTADVGRMLQRIDEDAASPGVLLVTSVLGSDGTEHFDFGPPILPIEHIALARPGRPLVFIGKEDSRNTYVQPLTLLPDGHTLLEQVQTRQLGDLFTIRTHNINTGQIRNLVQVQGGVAIGHGSFLYMLPKAADSDPPVYRRWEIATDQSAPLQVPGTILAVNSDQTKALCLVATAADGDARYGVVNCDLATGAAKLILDDEAVQQIVGGNRNATARRSHGLPPCYTAGVCPTILDYARMDPEWRLIAYVDASTDGNNSTGTLHICNLQTGKDRTFSLPADAADADAIRSRRSFGPGAQVDGITFERVCVRTGNDESVLTLATGHWTSYPAAGGPLAETRFSPDMTCALRTTYTREMTRSYVLVGADGVAHPLAQKGNIFWLTNETLVHYNERTIDLLDLAGHGRTVFSLDHVTLHD